MLKNIFGFYLSLTLALSSAAQAFTLADYEQALQAADKQDYGTAEALLRKALDEGVVNGHIHYNLATLSFRQGHLGQAMASLLEARSFLPRDPDVQANLQFVHKQIKDSLDIKGTNLSSMLVFWRYWFTEAEMFTASVLLTFLSSLVLLLFVRGRKKMPWLKSLLVPISVTTLLCWLGFSMLWLTAERWSAVTQAEVAVRSGPGEHNATLFELHEGAPFRITVEQNGWLQIWLSDGRKGWVVF